MTRWSDILATPRPGPDQAPAAYAVELAVIAIIYVALAKLGLTLASINPSASPVWPPTGLALGLALVRGPRIWPAIFVGAFVANVITAGGVVTAAIIATGNTLEALAAVWLLGRSLLGADAFTTPVGIVRFALAAIAASMVSATIGVLALAVGGLVYGNILAVWMTWWLGDFGGALVVGPLVVLWAQAVPPADRAPAWQAVAILAVGVMVGVVAFSPVMTQTAYRDPLGFLAVAPLVWAALRGDRQLTATVIVVLAVFAIWGTIGGSGPFARDDLNESFLLVLMFLISISVPALALSADVAVRRRSEERLLEVHADLDRRVRQRTQALADTTRALELETEQRRQVEADLAQAQKMEAIGQVTGGIAHDFNNLLMIVSGHADILRRRIEDPRLQRAAEAILAAAKRGENLTRQLLTFSRRQRLSPSVVDLRERIDAMRTMLGSSLRENITLTCEAAEDAWPVEVDVGELELALVNIAVNARDAMPEGGRFTIAVRNVAAMPGSGAARDYVAIEMTDTGEGVAPETLPRIFDPFFTTKPLGKGTGLGLSQVYGFAHQSGGAVTATSKLGEGTAVTVYLPRSHAPVDKPVAAPAGAETHHASGTILVVEDNPDVAEVTSALLGQLGYQVRRAENAADALRLIARGEHVDLVFSDIVMPGMDGITLGKHLREHHPDLRVLLTSGYSDSAQAAQVQFEILRKPFELSALESAIRTALVGDPAGR